MAGKYFLTHTHGTQLWRLPLITGLPQVVFDEREIEIDVMGDENTVGKQVENMRCHLFKNRGIPHHVVADPGQRSNISWNGTLRVYQSLVLPLHFFSIMQDDRYFGDVS